MKRMIVVVAMAAGRQAVVDTPQWSWHTNEADVIVWEYAGSNTVVLDDGSVAFAGPMVPEPAWILAATLPLFCVFRRLVRIRHYDC